MWVKRDETRLRNNVENPTQLSLTFTVSPKEDIGTTANVKGKDKQTG